MNEKTRGREAMTGHKEAQTEESQQVTENLRRAMERFYRCRAKQHTSVKHACKEVIQVGKDIAKRLEKTSGRE